MTKRNIVDCLRTGKAPSAQGRVGTVAEQRQRAADYIEELEAKLAQAVEAMDEAHTSIMNGCDGDALDILEATLSALKGQDR